MPPARKAGHRVILRGGAPPLTFTPLFGLDDGRCPRLYPFKGLRVPSREGGKDDHAASRPECAEEAEGMPGRHVGNICLGGDPLKPGVNPEAEGERFESVKEAGRIRSPRVALNKGLLRRSCSRGIGTSGAWYARSQVIRD